MKEGLDVVKFNLTNTMTKELIRFNILKKELINLRKKQVLDKNELIKVEKLENELNKVRISFIKEFRKNNKQEIIKYLELKDQEF